MTATDYQPTVISTRPHDPTEDSVMAGCDFCHETFCWHQDRSWRYVTLDDRAGEYCVCGVCWDAGKHVEA